jgi:dUTP pyrophosphatase
VRRLAGDELGPGPRGEARSGALAIPAKGAAPVDAPELPVRRLDPGLPPPAYAHPGDAGADLRAAADVVLPPGGRATVGTGIAIAVPEGYAAFVHPRSGLAARHGITVVNAPGTIDAGYRGEVRVVLLNTDPAEPFTVRRGDRIAQLVVQPVTRVRFLDVAELPPTPRGEGGFGSTGR